LQSSGAYFLYQADNQALITPELFDPIMKDNAELIESFTYITQNLRNTPQAGIKEITASDIARINSLPADIYGVQPNAFDVLLDDFVDLNWRSNSALSMGEQFYTPRGSQSCGVGDYVVTHANIDPDNHE